jgi:hypothetical protein
MTNNSDSFTRQLQRNAVALLSLVIALSGLGYNTWRNEKTEENRNERMAAFEILLKLGELQQVVFHHHYDQDVENRGNPRTGWIYALTIRDLSRVLPEQAQTNADKLLVTWGDNWEGLATDKDSVEAILTGIEDLREEILALLKSLE